MIGTDCFPETKPHITSCFKHNMCVCIMYTGDILSRNVTIR